MKEFNLKSSEIRKAIKFASKKEHELCELTGWYTNGVEDMYGVLKVFCEMCTVYDGRRVDDVTINCTMFDRRRSFATGYVSEL